MKKVLTTGMVLFLVLSFKNVLTWNSNRTIEGYHDGYNTDCPSTQKPAFISKKSLSTLGLIVVGPNTTNLKNGRTYNYYQTRELVKDRNWNFRKKTIFFVGGYIDNPDFFIYSKVMGNTFKDRYDNVLLMQAQHFMIRQYQTSVRMARPVGFHIAEMLTNLTAAGLNPKNLHLVGVSLGGHTMGFIGKSFYKLTGTKIGKMIGIDPAGPCFRNAPPDQRLDTDDADFVQVIFSNMNGLGSTPPVGHVNFFLNGGEYQTNDIDILPCSLMCSHFRGAIVYYTAILYPNSFIGVKCDNVQQAKRHECHDRVPMETNIMGANVNESNTGVFYVPTSRHWPYYLGEDGLKKENIIWSRLDKKFQSDILIL